MNYDLSPRWCNSHEILTRSLLRFHLASITLGKDIAVLWTMLIADYVTVFLIAKILIGPSLFFSLQLCCIPYILGTTHKFPYAHLVNQMNRASSGDIYNLIYVNIVEAWVLGKEAGVACKNT